jgi:hypothetical protein
MPRSHQQASDAKGWTKEQLIGKAERIGRLTALAAENILSNSIYMEQNYKSCFGMLMLEKRYGPVRLEAACSLALTGTRINYTMIKNILAAGMDTTITTIGNALVLLGRNPDQFEKLKANPDLIPNMGSEIIRWQTPLAYMRRIAKADTVLNGQFIRKGDKVVMWYASGNRDERVFERPDDFIVDRANARNHISFGFGVHRCMGNRLAELQLRILWEELLSRFENIEVIGEPEYVQSNFVRGISKMMVRLTPVSDT